MKNRIRILTALCPLLLASCAYFSSREVTVEPASASEAEAYYRDEFLNREGLSFDSENFLRGNLMQDDFTQDPAATLRRLDEYYTISNDPKYLRIAADLCRYIAAESEMETAIRCHLSALYYARAALAAQTRQEKSLRDFSAFRLMQIYNDACAGIFRYLKAHDLLANDSFSLSDLEGRRFSFAAPRFRLSVPPEAVADFSLCSDYKVNALRQKNRQPGIGIPLVGRIAPQPFHRALRMPAGMTIPVTLVAELAERSPQELAVQLTYQDTSLCETVPLGNGALPAGNWPLALDFSTPLACFLNDLPERNLLAVMLDPDGVEGNAGLYMVEPYQPEKIPVVFIHGLMSSPDTWVQMINSLKNDPVIRKRYQFWFYYYSSGAPVLLSAGHLRRELLAAREELCTTPEAEANFNRMVLAGHSMGGLVARTLLQWDPYFIAEKITERPWQDFCAELSEEDLEQVEDFAVLPALPFVHRVIFLAVPHRGAEMAQWSIARFGSRIIRLPQSLLKQLPLLTRLYRGFDDDPADVDELRDRLFTGIDNLDPDNPFIRALGGSRMKDELVYHSIIGDREQADCPGGSDGVVPYASSHLDGAASEVIVQSGHSVHRSPAAMKEVLRILLLHLKEQ